MPFKAIKHYFREKKRIRSLKGKVKRQQSVVRLKKAGGARTVAQGRMVQAGEDAARRRQKGQWR